MHLEHHQNRACEQNYGNKKGNDNYAADKKLNETEYHRNINILNPNSHSYAHQKDEPIYICNIL